MYYLPREHVTVCEDTSIRTVSLSRPTNLKIQSDCSFENSSFFLIFHIFREDARDI